MGTGKHLAVLGVCMAWAMPAAAADASSNKPPGRSLDTIVVTGQRPDEQVKQDVQIALHNDPVFYDGHVTVTIKDGVVTLSGIVFDDWDLRTARRIAKRIPGVKRVINDLEIKLGGE